MEVSNFVNTQLTPLVVSFSRHGVVEILPIINNSVMTCGLWQLDDNGDPYIPYLMAIQIAFGADLNDMTEQELLEIPIISVITEIPKSFFANEVTDRLSNELRELIKNQLLSFFELITFMITIDGVRVNPLDLMRRLGWSFRMVHGIVLRPSVTMEGNLGFRISNV